MARCRAGAGTPSRRSRQKPAASHAPVPAASSAKKRARCHAVGLRPSATMMPCISSSRAPFESMIARLGATTQWRSLRRVRDPAAVLVLAPPREIAPVPEEDERRGHRDLPRIPGGDLVAGRAELLGDLVDDR